MRVWPLVLLAGCGRLDFADRAPAADAPAHAATGDAALADARHLPRCPNLTFATPLAPPTGAQPRALVAGDFDGDGKQDIAVVNGNGSSFSELLGNGDGTFQPKRDFPTGAAPYSIAIGDLDGDSRPDLAVGAFTGDVVNVFLDRGGGAFASAAYPTGANPQSVAIGDVDGDGVPDLVTANNGDNTVSVFRNAGGGAFGSGVTFATGRAPYQVAIADITGDGRADLVVADQGGMMGGGGGVSVLAGTGGGQFQPTAELSTGSDTQPWSVAVADLDGNGSLDLAVANNFGSDAASQTISIFLNQGGGAFAPRVDYASEAFPWWISAADIDHDGILDLVMANGDANTASVRIGRGDGTFGSDEPLATGSNNLGLGLADFDGDGYPDIAIASQDTDRVNVLLHVCP